MADNKRIVLAYSGGLDTSVAISYLKERTGKDVVAVSLDVGQGGESLETIKQRALACGAVESYVVDARDEFANEYCMQALKANALYEGGRDTTEKHRATIALNGWDFCPVDIMDEGKTMLGTKEMGDAIAAEIQ